jgi:N-acetylmuramoyl-L-alanine amidase
MHPFVFYTLRAIVISGIFYSYYLVALRNKKLYNFNRFYLLASMLFSAIIPMIHIEWWQTSTVQNNAPIKLLQAMQANGGEEESLVSDTHAINIANVCLAIYYMVAALMVAATLQKIYALFRIKKSAGTQYIDGVCVIDTQLEAAPFSFLNNLYWNTGIDANSDTGAAIIRHEKVHIGQRHTLDKLFARAVLALFWINPIYWLIQKELSLVHEFIADEGATEGSSDTSLFARMLLQSHYGNKFPGILQPFFYSPIKTRILMLQEKNAPRYAHLRKLAVLPILAAILVLFSFSVKETNTINAKYKTVIVLDAGHGGLDQGGTGISGVKEKDLTLRITKEIMRLAPQYSISVVSTRTGDDRLTLEERVRASANAQAQLFMSIHVSKDDPENSEYHSGYEVIVSNKAAKHKESLALASAVVDQLNTMPINTIKLLDKNLVVLRNNPLPGILIECGNIDNAADLSRIQDDKQLEDLCHRILVGVATYANAEK